MSVESRIAEWIQSGLQGVKDFERIMEEIDYDKD